MSSWSFDSHSPKGIYVRYYGCVKCQKRHYDAEEHAQDLYRQHEGFQSKHGVQRMSMEEYQGLLAFLANQQEQSPKEGTK